MMQSEDSLNAETPNKGDSDGRPNLSSNCFHKIGRQDSAPTRLAGTGRLSGVVARFGVTDSEVGGGQTVWYGSK